jgi:hypothetical protein
MDFKAMDQKANREAAELLLMLMDHANDPVWCEAMIAAKLKAYYADGGIAAIESIQQHFVKATP